MTETTDDNIRIEEDDLLILQVDKEELHGLETAGVSSKETKEPTSSRKSKN